MNETRITSVLAHRKFGYFIAIGAVGAFVAFASGNSSAADPLENRYPYDPACAWGRIADGRGMLVRCIEKSEAELLVAASRSKSADAATEKPAEPEGRLADPEEGSTDMVDDVSVRLVQVKADEGTLSLAMKKLGAPKDRYLDCLAENGGLAGDSGEVQVRFLVRGRGRAEGVSVSKRRNVSKEAARCVADVVDRRLVGTPAAPIVGATAFFEFSRK